MGMDKKGKVMELKNEGNSTVGYAVSPPNRNFMSREELENILKVVLNDFWTVGHRAGSPAEDVLRESGVESKPLSSLSQEELERILNLMVGELWLPRNG